MKEKVIKNPATSVRQKVYNAGKAANVPGPKIYIRYFLERLLYRIMNSPYRNKFIVRGSSLLYIFSKESARQTKDLDFMGIGIDNDLEYMRNAFLKIISIPCQEDCVTFLPETLKVETIQSDKAYPGVRVSMFAKLEDICQKLSMDIGYDDVITPSARMIKYPVILKELPEFKVKAYTIETSLAEKIETIISRDELNTRMKDYYDIWYIVNNIEIDKEIFQKALKNTFDHRNTVMNENSIVFDITFYINEERTRMWNNFIKKSGLDYISFYDVGLFITTKVKALVFNK